MILGFPTLVFVHIVISLIGLATGFVVVYGLLTANKLDFSTALFLGSTVLTSLSGFILPADHFLPSHAIGIISIVVLAIAIFALYVRKLAGAWRWVYVATAIAALYLNAFVFVVQSFLKAPALRALAPTQSEPPFLAAQLALLVVFVALGVAAAKRFHPRTA